MNIQAARQYGIKVLPDAQDVLELLAFTLQCSKTSLLSHPEKALSPTQQKQYIAYIERCKANEPLAYIIGKQGFWDLELIVNQHTLIPRPETELLVESILANYDDERYTALDLGTGTGAIALALASERKVWDVCAVDASQEALKIAQQNATLNNISNVEFVQSNWFDALRGKRFDIIVSNPPYVASNSSYLQAKSLQYEPQSALVAGLDGMDDLHTIIKQAPLYLNKDGMLIVEHGFDQQNQVMQAFKEVNFSKRQALQDLSQVPRAVMGRLLSQ